MARSQFEEGLFTHKSLILGWMKDYALSSEVYKHDLSGTLHTGQLGDSQAPQFLKTDGSRQLSGNLAVIDGATIDGVDLSEHAANPSAHHAPVTVADSLSIDLTLGGVGGQQLSASVLFGTPVSLSASTINSQGSAGTAAKSNHTHAITASNDVSAAVVETILKSTSAGGLKLKQLDITRDLTVGNNVLNVDTYEFQVGHVGINCVPDAQFDLDVAGNLRAQGWIVGKHAIQVKDAVMICHFDGMEPYETNFTGNPTGHMGQAPFVDGGVYYREGKFGKGVIVRETETNEMPTPSFETGVGAWYGGGTNTVIQSAEQASVGNYSLKCTYQDNTQIALYLATALNASSNYVFSARIWIPSDYDGSNVSIGFGGTFSDATNIVTGFADASKRDQWQTIYATATIGTDTIGHLRFLTSGTNPSVGKFVYIDEIMFCKSDYLAPYFDGSFPGCSWSGTTHNSTSTAPTGKLSYNVESPLSGFSISFYMKLPISPIKYDGNKQLFNFYYDTNNRLIFFLRQAENSFYIYRNADGSASNMYANTGFELDAETWYHVAIKQSEEGLFVYVNGELVLENTTAAAINPYATKPNVLYLGSSRTFGSYPNALIDEFAIISRALSADEIRAIYESDAPIFAETSTWSWRTPTNLAWADANGLWARDNNGYDAFGVVGVNGYSWGGFGLDAGDIVLGRNVAGSSAIRWDISAGKFGFYGGGSATPEVEIGTDGKLYAGGGVVFLDTSGLTAGSGNDILKINIDDTNYRLWIGNSAAASAPFSVKKDGTIFSRGINLSTAIVTRTSAQSIPTNTNTIILYNSQIYVTSGMHYTSTNSGRIYAPVKGVYSVQAAGYFDIGVGAGSYRQLAIYKYNSDGSGEVNIASDYRAATVDASTYVTLSTMISLIPGQFVQSKAFHQAGTSKNFTPFYFSLTLIKLLD